VACDQMRALIVLTTCALAHGLFGTRSAPKIVRPPVALQSQTSVQSRTSSINRTPTAETPETGRSPFSGWKPNHLAGPRSWKLPTHFALPAVSYAGLATLTAGTLHLLSPLAWQGYALVGWSIGAPVIFSLGQLAMLGGAGVAKAMGGTETDDVRLKKLARDAAAAVGVAAPTVYEVKSREPNALPRRVSAAATPPSR